jgi:hypothetical protein
MFSAKYWMWDSKLASNYESRVGEGVVGVNYPVIL